MMNDPHILALHYTVHVRPTLTYDESAKLEHDDGRFRLSLAKTLLRVDMKEHHASAESARSIVDPFLDSWVLHAALEAQHRDFWFEYDHADVIDRSSPPGALHAAGRAKGTLSAILHTHKHAYAQPPRAFRATTLIKILFRWYQSAVDERMLAPAAGYFCLTAIKARVRQPNWPGGIERSNRVADALSVEREILNVMHKLSTETGDITTKRKVSDKAELDRPGRSHTAAELLWLCEAIRLLTLRLGEWEVDPSSLATITMGDLPPLT